MEMVQNHLGSKPQRVILSPGDILFVPAGWPHAVRNLPGPPTVAISSNYVDGSNFKRHLQELRWQALAENQQAHPYGAGATDEQSVVLKGNEGMPAISQGSERSSDADASAGRTAALLAAFEASGFDQRMEMEVISDVNWKNFKKRAY